MRERMLVGLARFGVLLLCLVIATTYFANERPDLGPLDNGYCMTDDAAIVMVYARHLAESGSIYWNLEDGRVDGVTSVLDVAIKAALLKVVRVDPFVISFFASIGFQLLAVTAGLLLIARLAAGSWALWIAGSLLLASLHPLAVGAAFQLESGLHVFLMFATVLYALWKPRQLHALVGISALGLATALARPEGAAMAAVVCGYHYVTRHDLSIRDRSAPLLVMAAGLAGYYVWHRYYFGHFAPNTYYAKRSDDWRMELRDGLVYVLRWAKDPTTCAAMILSPGALLLCLRKSVWISDDHRRAVALVSLLGVTSILMIIGGGGDGYEGGRFIGPPLALAIVAGVGVAAGIRLRSRWRRVVEVLGVGIPAGIFYFDYPIARIHLAYEQAKQWPRDSSTMFHCELPVIRAFEAAGIRSYLQSDHQRYKLFSDRTRVLDLSSLNDKEAAHSPWPGQNMWGKIAVMYRERLSQAELVHLGPRALTRTPIASSTQALWTEDDTWPDWEELTDFVPASVEVCGKYFNVFVKPNVVPRLVNYFNSARAGNLMRHLLIDASETSASGTP